MRFIWLSLLIVSCSGVRTRLAHEVVCFIQIGSWDLLYGITQSPSQEPILLGSGGDSLQHRADLASLAKPPARSYAALRNITRQV